MAAKKAPRWGVHYRIGAQFWKGLYKARSSFVVRARNYHEAMSAARNVPRLNCDDFIVVLLKGERKLS